MENKNNKYCGQCGKPNPLVHKFCFSCGAKFEGENPNMNKEGDNKQANGNRKAAITGAATGAVAGYVGSRLAQTVDKLASEGDVSDAQSDNNTTPAAFASNNLEDVAEVMAIDVDDDGIVDAIVIGNGGDDVIDAIVMDVDNDGYIDAIMLDRDNDGVMDQIVVDSDFDGKPDTSYTIEENDLDEDSDWEDFFNF